MGGGVKPFPQGLNYLESIEKYKQVCLTAEAKYRLSTPLGFSLDNVSVSNRIDGDGKFQLLYDDPAKDWFCSAEIRWPNRYMNVSVGSLKDPKHPWIYHNYNMADACTVTRSLVGEEEFAGQMCKDGDIDPKLMNGLELDSGKKFAQACIDAIPYGKKGWPKPTAEELFKKSRVINETDGDGNFSILYENPEKNFFCEGMVDSIQHFLAIRHGRMKDRETTVPDKALQMTDACTFTKAVVGEKDLVGKCVDKSEQERNLEHYLTVGFTAVASMLFYYGAGKLALKIYRRNGFFLSKIPFVRNFGTALLAYDLFDTMTGWFLPKGSAFRDYGKWVAGGVGLVAPSILARTVGTRLLATSTLARLGGLSRSLGNRFLAVAALNYGIKWLLVDNDYDSSLNHRATAQVYEEDSVYEPEWTDLLVVPGALKLLRGGCRWLAPDAMEWGVTLTGHGADVKEKMKKEDYEASKELNSFLEEVLPPLLTADPRAGIDPNVTIEMLRDGPIELSYPETIKESILTQPGGAQVLMNAYHMSVEDVELLSRKLILKKVQEAARFLVYADRDVNQWTHEIFNRDGTLKANVTDGAYEDQPYTKLIKHLPTYSPPPPDPWAGEQ